MNKYEEELFTSLFSTPLEVVNTAGQLECLDWDKSEDPILFNNHGVPIAVIKLSNGNGAKIRFDVQPPRLGGFSFEPNRFLITDSDFITLVKATRAGQSVEDYLFSELFRYPFRITNPKTGEIKLLIVGSFSVHDIGGIPVAIMSLQNGGWTSIRFDYDPPQLYLLDKSDGKGLDKAEFVELVKTTRRKRFGTAVLHRQNGEYKGELNDMATLEDAVAIAALAHKGQTDKAGAVYILHPLRLMMQMKSDAAMMTAVLHDVVEDSDWTIEQLRERGFTEEVLEAVECLTKRSGENYDAFIERVKTNPIACEVKLADLEDNMNVLRIDEISEKDLKRLEKYHRARKVLKQSQNDNEQVVTECGCVTRNSDFSCDERSIGTDTTVGRFGEVSIWTCQNCGNHWLHYFVEYEGFSSSGRWYHGLISDEAARTVTPETAVRVLESLDWYYYGGSYFRTNEIRKGSGTVSVNLGGGSSDIPYSRETSYSTEPEKPLTLPADETTDQIRESQKAATLRKYTECATNVTAKLKQMEASHQADLGTVWEEIKDQIERGESMFWEQYEQAIALHCEDEIRKLSDSEQKNLWLWSDAYFDWDEENQPEMPFDIKDVVKELASKVLEIADAETMNDELEDDEWDEDEELEDDEFDDEELDDEEFDEFNEEE